MNKTFYALTTGCYSDYRIIDITDNKDRAEKLQRLYNWGRENYEYDKMRIEEFPDSEEEHGLTVHLSKDGKLSVLTKVTCIIQSRIQFIRKKTEHILSILW